MGVFVMKIAWLLVFLPMREEMVVRTRTTSMESKNQLLYFFYSYYEVHFYTFEKK